MKILFLRILFLLILTFFQLSFIDVIAPTLSVPIVPIAAITAWVLVLGFPACLGMTVGLAFIFDVASSGSLTIFSLYSILLAYATSFFSRRVLIERQGFGIFLYSLFTAVSAFLYFSLTFIYFTPLANLRWTAFIVPQSDVDFIPILITLILSMVFFMLLYPLIKVFESRIALLSQKPFHKVK